MTLFPRRTLMPSKIYVSFSGADRHHGVELARRLEADGFHIVGEFDAIPTGQRWCEPETPQIKLCDVLLCVVTPAWLKSEYCHWELVQFIETRKPVIPLVYADMKALPRQLSSLQWIDLSHDFDDGYRALKEALTTLRR